MHTVVRRRRSLVLSLALAAALVPGVLGALRAPSEAQSSDLPPDAAKTWYFAEGNTLAGWYEFIVMINPSPSKDITVTIDFQLEEPAGQPQPGRTKIVTVPAGQRRTVSVYDTDVVGRTFTGVAARLTSLDVFVAERPMYFINNFDVGEINGAHDALGVNGASNKWYFAEGSTLQSPAPGVTTPQAGLPDQLRGFMPFFTMQNTSGGSAEVDIRYFTNNPDSTVTRRITVPNNSRVTTDIANAFSSPAYPGGLGAGYEGFGSEISSTAPIIVERPFYANRQFGEIGLVNSATDERGATTASTTTQLFAEGTMLSDFFEFLTIFNPNSQTSDIEVAYFVENSSTPITKTISVPATARRTIQVYNEADPAGLGRAIANASAPGSAGVSVKLSSKNGVGFVGERPMYFIRDFGNGAVNGAHDVLGASSADTSWFFAEGTTRPGFFEFVSIQNPNPTATTARLDYFVDAQPIRTKFRPVPANSRVTVVVYDPAATGALGLANEADFGLRVTSVSETATTTINGAVPIVVERPLYTNTPIAGSARPINGGHNTLGYQFSPASLPRLPGAGAGTYRWDLVSIELANGVPVVVPGGAAAAMAEDGTTITITGSGAFRDSGNPRDASGGGTWRTVDKTGAETGSGTYVVAGVAHFELAPGSFPSPDVIDAVGPAADARAGIVALHVVYSNGQDGVIWISCQLAGTPASVFEGATASMGYVNFWNTPMLGGSLFHEVDELGAQNPFTPADPGSRYRWDIISLPFPNVNAGGLANSRAEDNSTMTITGSGTFRANSFDPTDVTGGGTWQTFNPAGASTGSGNYTVSGFVNWVVAPGTAPSVLKDNIADRADARSGLAALRVTYDDGTTGILTVSCKLPVGSPASMFEGMTAIKGFVGYWNREPTPTDLSIDKNRTVFHLIPNLDLRKSASPAFAFAGDEVTYTLTVTNTTAGTLAATATGVSITDTLPSGAQYLRSSGGSESLGIVTFALPDMAPGNTLARTIVVSPTAGAKVNNVGVTSSNLGSDGAQASHTVVSPAPVTYNFLLSGANEVPAASSSDYGEATVTIDVALGSSNWLCHNVTVTIAPSDPTDTITGAHIHRGAAGVAGDILVTLVPAPGTLNSSANGCGSSPDASRDELAEIVSNPAGFYANVHSSNHIDGAVRGQL